MSSPNSYRETDVYTQPKRTGTDSSHYSCSSLPDDDPDRYLKASEVRRQVQEAPAKRVRLPSASGSARGRLASYPQTFKNTEKLPLHSPTPRQEYPVKPSGSWDPNVSNDRGGARGIYNPSDRSKIDVVYHDPKVGTHDRNFKLAAYRPAKKGPTQA